MNEPEGSTCEEVKAVVVTAEELGPSGGNPYDGLASGERRSRFVALLARIRRRPTAVGKEDSVGQAA